MMWVGEQVTKRVETDEEDWAEWNWRTEGDVMVNGAFFVPSGVGLSTQYAKASSVEPKSAALIQQLTMNAGALSGSRYPPHFPPLTPSSLSLSFLLYFITELPVTLTVSPSSKFYFL